MTSQEPSRGRFVILWHETPSGADRPSHYDLMFERGPALRTWALASAPKRDTDIQALALPDHRLAYLDYEGEISGGRGVVSRWDAGGYDELHINDVTWKVRLHGTKAQGQVSLQRLNAESQRWVFRWAGD